MVLLTVTRTASRAARAEQLDQPNELKHQRFVRALALLLDGQTGEHWER